MRLETILRAQAVRYPDKIALVCGSERIAYRDLDRAIRMRGQRIEGAGARSRATGSCCFSRTA